MQRIRELVIASHNPGKIREFGVLLAPFGVKVRSAEELGLPEPEETGDTFVENALLKAEAAARGSGLPSLSDDSGLVIPALDGAPGIYSARWAGPTKDFSVAIKRIQAELVMLQIPEQKLDAHFVCALALCFPPEKQKVAPARDLTPPLETHIYEGKVHGRLVFPARGKQGFGYDPIFVPEGHMQTFGEMEPEEKHSMSHRARAMELFVNEWFPDVSERRVNDAN